MRMMLRNLYISLTIVGCLFGEAYAAERPWGVITPFGSAATEPRGFQGIYNPWANEIADVGQRPPAQAQKRIRQGWQNIYRPRTSDVEELWPDSAKKGERAANRTFGDKSLSGEVWPERRSSHQPYRSMERFRTPFGTFAPSMPAQPFAPYGSNFPSWQRY